MRTITEAEAHHQIALTRILPTFTASIRLWAITQLFYRQPIGEDALAELHNRIGDAAPEVLFFVSGFLMGSGTGINPDFSGLLPPLDGEPK